MRLRSVPSKQHKRQRSTSPLPYTDTPRKEHSTRRCCTIITAGLSPLNSPLPYPYVIVHQPSSTSTRPVIHSPRTTTRWRIHPSLIYSKHQIHSSLYSRLLIAIFDLAPENNHLGTFTAAAGTWCTKHEHASSHRNHRSQWFTSRATCCPSWRARSIYTTASTLSSRISLYSSSTAHPQPPMPPTAVRESKSTLSTQEERNHILGLPSRPTQPHTKSSTSYRKNGKGMKRAADSRSAS